MHDLGLAAAHADRIVVMRSAAGSAPTDRPTDVLTAELLSDVYEHPIEVMRHPRTGGLVIVPWRDERALDDRRLADHIELSREEHP